MSPTFLLACMFGSLAALLAMAAWEWWKNWRTDKQMKRGFEYLKRHKLYVQPDRWVVWKNKF